ncbi:MFS transporter [Edaphobacillus lindanitolerans]|uniref:Predicted arabinose efflux permease, MFS family n=1 Tax=Edaphobacillus lindanitolerans TaxID=550447 RepID=A0A1U7PK73_9BACI|nr:MFS transporter [Edaphobacillus lindanitolerans]SIT84132.1 Predicted arabinose efflux permease, MFS family [Edaphobacillus lindanitolerans]
MNQEQTKQEHKLWTKDFVFVSAINFFLMLIMYLLMVTIGPFASEQFNAGASTAGLVSGIYIIGALVARFIAGAIVEKVGSKKILLIGLILYLITGALYFAAVNLPLMLLVRFFHGMGMGIGSTATGTIVAKILPPDRRGEGIGYYSMSAVLAAAIGPFLGILLTKYMSFNMIFVFCLVLAAIGLFMGLSLKNPASSVNAPVHTEKQKFGIWSFMEKSALPIALVTLIVALGYAGVLSFIMFYAQEIGLVTASSFFFLVYAIAVLISRPFTGRLLDLKGANVVVIPALILFSGGLFLLSTSSVNWMLLVSGILIGLGFGNFQSSAQAIAIKVADPHRLGLATSTYFIALDAGVGFGPYVLGLLVPTLGYAGMYKMLAAVIIVSLVLYILVHGIKEWKAAGEKTA